ITPTMTRLQLRRLAAVLAASLLAIPLAAQGPPPGIDPAWSLAGKARVTEGARAMVASVSPIASEVGRDIMRRGGNAVDAAVAVGFALAVVHPEAGNIGGGGFMVIRLAGGRGRALHYRGNAPAIATHDMYLDSTGAVTDKSVIGHLSAGVPGSVAGLAEAARRYGTMKLPRLMEPAIRYAREGFVLDSFRSASIGGS